VDILTTLLFELPNSPFMALLRQGHKYKLFGVVDRLFIVGLQGVSPDQLWQQLRQVDLAEPFALYCSSFQKRVAWTGMDLFYSTASALNRGQDITPALEPFSPSTLGTLLPRLNSLFS
jgi:hypothetical protein